MQGESSQSDDWKDHAEFKENVTVDIGFSVHDSFYYGPPDYFTPEMRREMSEPLFVPDIEMSGGFVLTKNVLGREPQLLAHYQDVIEKSRKHHRTHGIEHYFWNRPVIYEKGGFCISFPWHDTFGEGKDILTKLATNGEGEVFWDVDQGWELEIYGRGDMLYARERDPDEERLYCQVKFEWESMRVQARALADSVTELIGYLSRETGFDYWT